MLSMPKFDELLELHRSLQCGNNISLTHLDQFYILFVHDSGEVCEPI